MSHHVPIYLSVFSKVADDFPPMSPWKKSMGFGQETIAEVALSTKADFFLGYPKTIGLMEKTSYFLGKTMENHHV